jgi:hypothetical protein
MPDFHEFILGARMLPYSIAVVVRHRWLKLADECSIIDYEPCIGPDHENAGCLPIALAELAKGMTVVLKMPRDKYQKNGLYKSSRPILAALYSYMPPEARWKTGFSTCLSFEATILAKVYAPRIFIVPETCEIEANDKITVIPVVSRNRASDLHQSKASAWIALPQNQKEELFAKLKKGDSLENQLTNLFEIAYSENDPVHLWWKHDGGEKFSNLPALIARHKAVSSWNERLEIMFGERVPALLSNGLIPEDILIALIKDENMPTEQKQSYLEYCRKRMNFLGIGVKRFNAAIERDEEERAVLEEIREMKECISAQSSAQTVADKALREYVEKQMKSFAEQSNQGFGSLVDKQNELQALVETLPTEINKALTEVKETIEFYKINEKFGIVESSVSNTASLINNKFKDSAESLAALLEKVRSVDSNVSSIPSSLAMKLDGVRAAVSEIHAALSRDIKNIEFKMPAGKVQDINASQIAAHPVRIINPKKAGRDSRHAAPKDSSLKESSFKDSSQNAYEDLMLKLMDIEYQIKDLKDQSSETVMDAKSKGESVIARPGTSKAANLRKINIKLYIDSVFSGINPPSIELLDKENNKMSADSLVQNGVYHILYNGRPIIEKAVVNDEDIDEDIRVYTYKVISRASRIPILFKKEEWYEYTTGDLKPAREPYPIEGYKFGGWKKKDNKFIAKWVKKENVKVEKEKNQNDKILKDKYKNDEDKKKKYEKDKNRKDEIRKTDVSNSSGYTEKIDSGGHKSRFPKKTMYFLLAIGLCVIAATVSYVIWSVKAPTDAISPSATPYNAQNVANSPGTAPGSRNSRP